MTKSEIEHLNFLHRFIAEQEKLGETSNKLKLHFAFEALRIALTEAEKATGIDTTWIYDNLSEELSSKLRTAQNNYIFGLFIYGLTFYGAKPEPTIDKVAEWTGSSDRKWGAAFYEFRKLSKVEESGFLFDFLTVDKQGLIAFIQEAESKKPFPADRKDILDAFNKLKDFLNHNEGRDFNLG